MVKRASDGMVIRYGGAGAMEPPPLAFSGKELTKYMAALNDYLGFFEKVGKRLRNDDVVTRLRRDLRQRGQRPCEARRL